MTDFSTLTDEQRERLMSFANGILTDPKTRKDALKLAKIQNPQFTSPELEMDDRIEQVRTEEAAKRKELEDKWDNAAIEQRRAQKAEELKERGYTLEAVEKVMTEEKIGSYDTAIKYMDAQSKLAPSTPASVTRMSMPENVKDIMKNPTQWAREQAHTVMNEVLASRKTG
jgi:hypothetical protein